MKDNISKYSLIEKMKFAAMGDCNWDDLIYSTSDLQELEEIKDRLSEICDNKKRVWENDDPYYLIDLAVLKTCRQRINFVQLKNSILTKENKSEFEKNFAEAINRKYPFETLISEVPSVTELGKIDDYLSGLYKELSWKEGKRSSLVKITKYQLILCEKGLDNKLEHIVLFG